MRFTAFLLLAPAMAAAAPHGHDGHDHMVEHEHIHFHKNDLDAEKALLAQTAAHLKAEKQTLNKGWQALKGEKRVLNAANKELKQEKKALKKEGVWKEEKAGWKDDKQEWKDELGEWRDAKTEWQGERKDWANAKKDLRKEKSEHRSDVKEWKQGHKEFHKEDLQAHKEIMGEKKDLNKEMRGLNQDIRKMNRQRKFLKKKGLWKEEKAEWKDAKKDLQKEKKSVKADIAEWKDGHQEWHGEHDSHNHRKKWHGKKVDYWKEGMHDVSGDPFVVDQSGKKVQFFLRTDQEELLLRCGAMQMYGRTMGTDIAGDHQQWFDRMRFVIGNQEQLLVGVNKGATQVGLEQDGIDVIAPNASHKRDSSVGQVVQKPLNILQVMVEGAKMSMTGAVATDSALIAIWSGGPVETVQFSDGNTVIQVKSAIAQKFTGKNEQKLYTHLDLRFMEVKTSECSAGLLAEIWGFAPMSEKTAAMLQPPQ